MGCTVKCGFVMFLFGYFTFSWLGTSVSIVDCLHFSCWCDYVCVACVCFAVRLGVCDACATWFWFLLGVALDCLLIALFAFV